MKTILVLALAAVVGCGPSPVITPTGTNPGANGSLKQERDDAAAGARAGDNSVAARPQGANAHDQ
jgi:hypothetical protein